MALGASVPLTWSFADEEKSFQVASLNLDMRPFNEETAGSGPVYHFDRKNFMGAKDVIIGIFDFFGDDDVELIRDDTGKVVTVKPLKKPDYFAQPEQSSDVSAHDAAEKATTQKTTALSQNNRPLTQKDIETYKRIFSHQSAGDIVAADKQIAKLKDHRLRGYYLYQRYMHPTAYKTNFDELRSWLANYAELPGAKNIYSLALRKKPQGYKGELTQPVKAKQIARMREPGMYYGAQYKTKHIRSAGQANLVKSIKRSIRSNVKSGDFSSALLQLKENGAHLDPVEYDVLRSYVAQGYLHRGHLKEAYALASQSFQRSGEYAPASGWVAGLASWKNGQFTQAAKYFQSTANSKFASSWKRSAGAFWAARSYMKANKARHARTWLYQAAEHPRTFYGLLATRALGKRLNFDWSSPRFTSAHKALLLSTKAGQRASDLVSVGQIHMAEAELLRIRPEKDDKAMREALLAYSMHAGLPALSLRAGKAFKGAEGEHYQAALYPLGNWKARGEYKIDPDLVHAIMRQESRFDARAESHSGALGLMQIMPTTASFISGEDHMESRTGQEQLLEAATNLTLGQKYIEFLFGNRHINNDLLSMLIAYNAGPGNLSRWQKRWDDVEDPLLFIELIPVRETRDYVEKVLANFWMYRARSGLVTPTLDALAKGRKALYTDALRANGFNVFKVAQTQVQ